MSDTVIKVENLSKLYRLGVVGTGTLSHDLNRWWHRVQGKEDPYLKIGQENDRTSKGGGDYAWALQDVNFEVKQGDVLGVIGKNGAGKSTLLKILSRVTQPTTGSVKVKGRIASLLEVGTGFHPELTGRENIFLNGAILGMSKSEIRSKFDEIVGFSGVERYVDTPVKRYSSGMYVRLAFAVAAHLEPEILIVDEVLAVGDAEFQKKCLGKMGEVAGEGRTVLFVSHNMLAVKALCESCLFLKNGKNYLEGTSEQVVNAYLLEGYEENEHNDLTHKPRKGNGKILFTHVRFYNEMEEEVKFFISGKSGKIRLFFNNTTKRPLPNINIALGIDDFHGNRITHLNNELTGNEMLNIGPEVNYLDVIIDNFSLMPSNYKVTLFSSINNDIADWIISAFALKVEAGDFYNTGRLIPEGQGNFLLQHHFEI